MSSHPTFWMNGEAGDPLGFSQNATLVLKDRYLRRDDDGKVVETLAEMLRRVARVVAAPETAWGASHLELERLEEQFYRLLTSRRFLPNSPTLMNAGRPLGMLSACFVLPLGDSIEEIMETARQMVLVQRAGGGTGIDLSELRPKGSIIRSSGGTTDGPLSFLEALSGMTNSIQQGAFRRGANMGIMRIDHPDIRAFIDLKSDLTQVTNYNLSVAMTDEFMASLKANPNRAHVVLNPHTGKQGYLDRETGLAQYDVAGESVGGRFWTVGEVWRWIVERACESGDPGLVFIDQINRGNPTPQLGPIRATNPCGEQPLLPYEACNLGSVNLAAFFEERAAGTTGHPINWKGLEETVELSVRFLDNVVEANKLPSPEIREATGRTRKIGLGVMGFADLLFQIGIPYDSEDGLELANAIGQFIQEAAWRASERLAESRGAFPAWQGSVWDKQRGRRAMRNAQVTTIAPTGTISIIAGCSSGIEPVFSLAFQRHVLGGKQLLEVNSVFQAALRKHLCDEKKVSEVLDHAVAHGSIQDHRDVPEQLKTVFRTARDVSAEWHVRMQAAWQGHTDGAVSKTVNLPASATIDDVKRAFSLAHELKCKGITVYRDGSRSMQPMALAAKSADEASESQSIKPIKLPQLIPSVRLRQPTPFGNMHLHISVEPQTGQERELFAQLGKGGDLANSDLEAICRLVSLLLRSGGDICLVIDQLEDIGSSLSVPAQGGRVRSLADGLAKALKKYVHAKQEHGLEGLFSGRVNSLDEAETVDGNVVMGGQELMFRVKCPQCDSAGSLAFEEGCLKCHSCGFAAC